MEGNVIIYEIFCKKEKKSYVGQTEIAFVPRDTLKNRLTEHFNTSRDRSTPLYKAMKEHGRKSFKIKEIDITTQDQANIVERKWILEKNTLVPNGYNVQEWSNCRWRKQLPFVPSEIAEIEIRGIKKDGLLSFVRLYVTLRDNKTSAKRLAVHGKTFAEALQAAESIVSDLPCETKITRHFSLNESVDLLEKYKQKICSFDGVVIKQIRVATHGKLGYFVVLVWPE